MTDISVQRPPAWFWAVSGLALLWNLLGVAAYLMLAYEHPAAVGDMTPAQQQLNDSMPAWVMGAYAVAVFAGALGAIGLLVRKRWAKLLFGLSLVAVLAQQLWVLVLSDSLEVMGGSGGLSAAVIVVAAGLLWFAGHAEKRGWLS